MSLNKLAYFIPGLGQAIALADTGNKIIKIIFFIILLILSIVSMSGASGGVLALTIIVFIMTIILPFKNKIGLNTNIKVISFLSLYFILALTITILASRKKDDNKPKTKRSSTGIVVIISIYFLGSIYAFFMADAGVKSWSRDNYFLN
jgi:energy-coupling factor transporter transmembrane protein EcfT